MRIAKRYLCSSLVVLAACGGAATDPAKPASGCAGGTDTAKMPLNDLRTGCYLSVQGGLYPGGGDSLPAAHLAAGLAASGQIQPLSAAGSPNASGKIVLVSIGMSNTTQEFCSQSGAPGSCESVSFIGQAMADPTVNHQTLVLVDGAAADRRPTIGRARRRRTTTTSATSGFRHSASASDRCRSRG